MMSFNQANTESTFNTSMNLEQTAQTHQASQCDQTFFKTCQSTDFSHMLSQISATDASSTKTEAKTSSIGSTGPVKKKWSRFVEANSQSSAGEASVPTSEDESQEECTEAMRRMQMRCRPRQAEEEKRQEVLLNKRAACIEEESQETEQFECLPGEPQPSKMLPRAPRPYYLPHPHHGGHGPYLPGAYAFGLVNLSTFTTLGQTGPILSRDLDLLDRDLRDPLRVSLLQNQLGKGQQGYEHPQQQQGPQQLQHLQQQQRTDLQEEIREQEPLEREFEGSALLNVFTSPQGTTTSNPNCNPPNNNRNWGLSNPSNAENTCCTTLANESESCFSCGQEEAASAAGGAGAGRGSGSGSQSSGSCSSCSLRSCCSKRCLFKRSPTETTTTLTQTTTAMDTEDVVVGSPVSSVLGQDGSSVGNSPNAEAQTDLLAKNLKESSENKCSSSCKQILSDVPSHDAAATRYAARHGGRYIQLKVRFHDKFSFKCTLDHKIQLTSEQMTQNKWCLKCDDLFKTAQRYAKKKEGTLIDEKISPLINFKCCRGHIFQLKPAEKLTKWCSTCSQSSSINYGTSIPEGISWHYIGATQKLSKNPTFQPANEKLTQNQDLLEVLNNLELATTYAEIKKLAVVYLNKYLKETTSSSPSDAFLRDHLEQFVWVYRLIIMPESLLKHLLFQFGDKQARVNYRRLCILTHPDKNCHPLAGKAFQKLLCAFTLN